MTLKRYLRCLRLKKGDALLLRAADANPASIVRLSEIVRGSWDFKVPIICVPDKDSLKRIPLEVVKKIHSDLGAWIASLEATEADEKAVKE